MQRSKSSRSLSALAITLALVAAGPVFAETYYVSTCGNDAWAGTGAFCRAPSGPKRTIQAAIDVATDGDEIRVTAGTYTGQVVFDGKAVRLLALTGPNLTTIDGNGAGTVVLCANGEGPGTIIEGFTITGGHAFDGAGMICFGTSPTIDHCDFEGNVADGSGGGLYVLAGAPLVTGCGFYNNVADDEGGGMVAFGGSPTIVGSTFGDNTSSWNAGGLSVQGGAQVTVDACTFVDNEAEAHGGAISNSESTVNVTGGLFDTNASKLGGAYFAQLGTSTFEGAIFELNAATTGGASAGGAAYITQGDVTFDACTFTSNVSDLGGALAKFGRGEMRVSGCGFDTNTAFMRGGGLWAELGDFVVEESTFDGNTASEQSGHLHASFGAQVEVRSCSFLNGFATDRGGAISVRDSATRVAITGSSFGGCSTANASEGGGGAISHAAGTLLVSNSLFGNNLAANDGGAILSDGGTATIVTSGIGGNQAGTGGGVYAGTGGNVTVAGCLLTNNEADGGGAFYDQGGDDTRMVNCTVVGNTANLGGALLGAGDTRIVNSIVRDNGALAIFGTGNPVIGYSNIEGGAPGLGNLDVDPGFMDAGSGNYRLGAGSFCVDAGANHAVPADAPDLDADGNVVERLPWDLDHEPRFADAAEGDTGCGGPALVDMGAYERAGTPAPDILIGDVNDDGTVDFEDLVMILAAWGPCAGCCPADLDDSGEVGFEDLLIFLSQWSG